MRLVEQIYGGNTTPRSLDADLAILASRAVAGWPDEQPITASLVSSLLRPPPGARQTFLVSARGDTGTLRGWAALVSAPTGGTARLWGPVVPPDDQRHTIGSALLAAVRESSQFRVSGRILTAGIPRRRGGAQKFFANHGWRTARNADLMLATSADERGGTPYASCEIVTCSPHDERQAVEIGKLYAAVNPHVDEVTASTTLDRWRTDPRFEPDQCLLAYDGDRLVGAAVLYPLASVTYGQPSQVAVHDVLVEPKCSVVDRERMNQLISAAVRTASQKYPGAPLRAVSDRPLLSKCLREHNFQALDVLSYYEPNPS